jgi:hypothetical protein
MVNFRFLLLLTALGVCAASAAYAADSGNPLSVSVFAVVDQEYNDNLYLTNADKVREFITYAGAGALAKLETRKNRLDFSYKVRKVFYWDYEDDDGIDTTNLNYLAQNLNLEAATQLSDRVRIGIEESYLVSRRPREYYVMTDRTSAARYWANRVAPYVEYQLGKKIFLMLKYKYDVLRYTERSIIYDEDATENRGYLTLKYRLNPRRAVDLDYQYWQRDHEISPSYHTNQVTVGYEHLFRVLRGEARCGYLRRTWKEEIEGRVKNRQGFVYKVSASAQTQKSRASLGVEETQSDLTGFGSDYRVRMLSWGLGHTFLGKVSVDLGGYYQQCRYQELLTTTETGATEKRRDDIWNINTTIEYPIHKWLSLSLSFSHSERESNDTGIYGDYAGNQILLTIKPRYETKR